MENSPASPHVLAVIPARYASTRFPGKPLVDIAGKPMIAHVWERAKAVPEIGRVIVATDDTRIEQAALAFGSEVRMTSPDHPSGTDRIWEVAAPLAEFDWVLNIQGDEPFMNPGHLVQAIQAIGQFPAADIITLVTPIQDEAHYRDPNVVKAALADSGEALYFSRAPIPYHRDQPDEPSHAFRHIGLYLYRRAALERFTKLPPSRLETVEKLEQLRALEARMKIYAVIVDAAPVGVDTPADLVRILDSAR